MAELSRRSGVPVATIKYYLREGLLPPGAATGATRATYSPAHLRRLRLIRALLEIGELPVASIGRILAAVDDEAVAVHDLLGTVQYALGPRVDPQAGDPDWQAALGEVDSLIRKLGWQVRPASPARALLGAALVALRRTDPAPQGPDLRVYAKALSRLAALEVAAITAPDAGHGAAPAVRGRAQPGAAPGKADGAPGEATDPVRKVGDTAGIAGRIALTESAVAGMVLYERVIIALRRLAQEDASARRFAGAAGRPVKGRR